MNAANRQTVMPPKVDTTIQSNTIETEDQNMEVAPPNGGTVTRETNQQLTNGMK